MPAAEVEVEVADDVQQWGRCGGDVYGEVQLHGEDGDDDEGDDDDGYGDGEDGGRLLGCKQAWVPLVEVGC